MNCLWDTVEQFVVEQRSGEVPLRTRLPQAQQFRPGQLSMSPARRSRREVAAEDGPGIIWYSLSDSIKSCGSCSNNRIGDLNTSKAKLRGSKYQREKTKTKLFF